MQNQLGALSLHRYRCIRFQGCISIIVISGVVRSLAAARGNRQTGPHLLSSPPFCRELPKLDGLTTVRNPGERLPKWDISPLALVREAEEQKLSSLLFLLTGHFSPSDVMHHPPTPPLRPNSLITAMYRADLMSGLAQHIRSRNG